MAPLSKKIIPLICALIHVAALAASEDQVIRLGVFPAPPYNYLEEDGTAKGFAIDLFEKVAEQENWKVEYVGVTWAEGLEGLQSGKIDLLPSVAYTKERAEIMDYCYESVLNSWGQIFAKPNGAQWQMPDLEGRKIGITRLDINGVNFARTAFGLGITCSYNEYATHEEVLAAVQRGEVEGGVVPQHYGYRYAASFNLVPTGIQFSPISSYFAAKKGKQREVLSRISSNLVRWKEDNNSYYFEAMNRWLGTGSPKRVTPPWLLITTFGGLGTVVLLLILVRFLRSQILQRTEELRQREKKYRQLFENMTTGFALFEVVSWQGEDFGHFRFLEVNPAFELLVGIKAEELVGQFSSDLIPELNASWLDDFSQVAQTGVPRSVLNEFGTIKRVLEVWIFSPSPGQVAAVCADITDRRRAEDQLKLLSLAISQAEEVVVITDANGAIEYANPAFEVQTGHAIEAVLGGNPRVLKSGKHTEAFYADMWKALTEGKVWNGRIENKRKNGDIFTAEASIAPVRDSDGTISHFVAVQRDITNELVLEAQYRQAQKMEAVGQLAGGVAHDFNNILQTIIGFAELLLHGPSDEEAMNKDLMEIKQAARNGASLSRQLLAFSREQRAEFHPLNLNEVIEEEARMLRRLLGENVRFDLQLAPELLPVQTDRVQMTQVIMNLCVNARDAMPEGGHLTISTHNHELGEKEAAHIPEAKAGRFVRLSVTDTGEGIPPNIKDKLFEPFFTTKGLGKGTGLGLSVIYGIARQHNGWIDVESTPRKGATFHVHFQASSPAPALPVAEPRSERPIELGGGKRVLIVEDDSVIQELGRRIFENMGYRTSCAGAASEARAIFAESKGAYDLLVCDIGLPDDNGILLAKELTAHAPNLPVLFMSGGENTHDDEGLEAFTHDFIRKPFSVRTILTSVGRLTNGVTD